MAGNKTKKTNIIKIIINKDILMHFFKRQKKKKGTIDRRRNRQTMVRVCDFVSTANISLEIYIYKCMYVCVSSSANEI